MPAMTSTERIFLRVERPGYPFDIAGLMTLEPSPEGPLPFEQVRALVNQRYHQLPPLTRVIARAPLGIGDERWTQAPDIDIDEHVREETVPEPGDEQALLETVLELTEEPLDRRRPLWQVWYLTGMADGAAALLVRVHHATIDGVGLMNLNSVLFDTEPTPLNVDDEPPPLRRRPARSLLGRALWEVPDRVASQVGTTARLAGRVGAVLGDAVVEVPNRTGHLTTARLAAWLLDRPQPAEGEGRRLPELPGYIPSPSSHPPVTVFNQHVHDPTKSLAVTSVPLDDVKEVRRAFPTVTVNDIFLAQMTGSLRSYLAGHGGLPSGPIRTTCPVNLRAADHGPETSNSFTTMWVDLPVDLDDPAARLQAVSASATAAKNSLRESQASWDALADLGDLLLPGVVAAVMAFAGTRVFGVLPPTQNLTMSTLIGSSAQLYLGTRKITHLYARTIICPPIHLFVSSVTYAGRVDFSVTTVKELCSDPEVLADGLRVELDRLLEAARAATSDAEATPRHAAPRRRREVNQEATSG